MTDPVDIKNRVAARREQIAHEQRQATQEAERQRKQQEAEKLAVRQAQHQQAVSALEITLTDNGIAARREQGQLIIEPAPPAIDSTGLYFDQARKLLKEQARRSWTPAENRRVIGGITAALTVVAMSVANVVFPVWIITFICIVVGILSWSELRKLNQSYLNQARETYPVLAKIADGEEQPKNG